MIRLTNVHKEFENGTKALKGVSMQIDDGEFVFLVGPSGSGKSTIIRLITGELEVTSISPVMSRMMVDFPEPDGPTRKTNSPSSMCRLTLSSARLPAS